jgi:hypothetical protein
MHSTSIMHSSGISCIWNNPFDCFTPAIKGITNAAVPAAWDAICTSFANAAVGMLKSFAGAFASIPDVNPASAGISSAYGISLSIAAVIAVLLIFGGVIRTAFTADGSALAQALTGGVKAFIAWVATAAVATAALAATNNVTDWIVKQSAHSQAQFAVRMGDIVSWFQIAGAPPGPMQKAGVAAQTVVGGSLLLIVALIAIALVIILWFELLLRGAALSVLIAVAPIPAAGQMGETTKVWWQRTCSAAIQLLILKPVIALVFAVGFAMSGGAKGIEGLLEGLLVLVLAVFSWPVIARFFTFASVQASSSGLSTALGFAVGRMSGGSGNGGSVSGVDPRQWSRGAEQRTMAARGDTADGAAGVEGGAEAGAGTAGGSAGGTGGSGAGGTGAAVLAGVGWALHTAHKAGTQLAGRMEQTAGHAGMPGAYPYSTVGGSGSNSGGRGQRPRRSGTGGAPVTPYGNPGPESQDSYEADPGDTPAPPPTNTDRSTNTAPPPEDDWHTGDSEGEPS